MKLSRFGLMSWVGTCDRSAKNVNRRTKAGVVMALVEHRCEGLDWPTNRWRRRWGKEPAR